MDEAQNKTMMAMRERQEAAAVSQATVAREECMKQLQALLSQRVLPLENLVEQAQILNRPIFKFTALYVKIL